MIESDLDIFKNKFGSLLFFSSMNENFTENSTDMYICCRLICRDLSNYDVPDKLDYLDDSSENEEEKIIQNDQMYDK